MKVVADDKIPFLREPLEQLADEVVWLPGAEIGPQDVRDADALLVRTRTRVNEHLLSGSRVRFVATATIGLDHLDTAYLDRAGIRWTNCPGCNATSVGQYVRNSLFALLQDRMQQKAFSELTVGVVGVGHVGQAVCRALEPLGCRLLLCDPPRAEREGAEGFVTMEQIAAECDVVTLHTPLERKGPYPTLHLVDDAWLRTLARRPVLINSSRGEVADNEALERALDEGLLSDAIIDTWEDEPHIRLSLLRKVFIGTPHVAGYSADGKSNATRMTLQALCQWMNRPMEWEILPPPLPSSFQAPADPVALALALYDPRRDSARLKLEPEKFEFLRGHYPLRRESL